MMHKAEISGSSGLIVEPKSIMLCQEDLGEFSPVSRRVGHLLHLAHSFLKS